MGKAIYHIFDARRIQNISDGFFENISKCYDTVAVHTAGNHRTVTEDAKMIPQAVAKDFIPPEWSLSVRPYKAVAPFQMKLIMDPDAAAIFGPFALKTTA